MSGPRDLVALLYSKKEKEEKPSWLKKAEDGMDCVATEAVRGYISS